MRKGILLAVMILVVIAVSSSMIISYATFHVDYSDPDWQCKKWIGIAELAKQDYPHFLEDSLEMGKMKCGFDISEFI